MEATRGLAIDLYRQTSSKLGNLLLSPYSIWMALAMVLPGARGATRQQLVARLGIDDVATVKRLGAELAKRAEPTQWQAQAIAQGYQTNEGLGFHLEVANKLWVQHGYPIHPAYAAALADAFAVDPAPVDFHGAPDAAVAAINRWVHDRTHGRIPTIVSSPDLIRHLRAMLANAIYFKAGWADEFNTYATRPLPFRLRSGETVPVPTMARSAYYAYAEDRDAFAVQLPYINPDVALIVIVPRAFEAYDEGLSSERVAALVKALDHKMCDLKLPKFRFETSLSLAEPLRAVGLDRLLSAAAELGGVSDEAGFHVGEVLHKTFIAVDEKGTEAAAVTAMMFAGAGMPPKPIAVNVDRPFYLLIHDVPTQTALFFGRVLDPR